MLKGRCGGWWWEETSSGLPPIYRAVDMDRTVEVGRAHARRW